MQISDEPTRPYCISCGAVAEHRPWGWETAHELDCEWMADADAPSYPR